MIATYISHITPRPEEKNALKKMELESRHHYQTALAKGIKRGVTASSTRRPKALRLQ